MKYEIPILFDMFIGERKQPTRIVTIIIINIRKVYSKMGVGSDQSTI